MGLHRALKVLLIASIAFMSTNAFCGNFYNDSYSSYAGSSDTQEFSLEPNLQSAPSDDQAQDQDAGPSDDIVTGGDVYAHTAHDAYVYGGYVYSYRFLNKNHQTIINEGESPFVYRYAVKGNTPDHYHGIEVGVGKALSKYVDVQIDYVQDFHQSKKGLTYNDSASMINNVSMQGVDVGLVWVVNPSDRIQAGLKVGARVAEFDEKITIPSTGEIYHPEQDVTEINPRAGFDVNFQITKDFSLRVDTMYTASVRRTFHDGGVQVFAGLSYKL